jgi:para-aminobenzoate synthetase component 1
MLATLLGQYRLDVSGPVPFVGGAMGFLGYELGRYLERLPQRHPPDDRPEMAIGFYDLVIAFDTVARRAWILSSGFPETEPRARVERAEARTRACRARLDTLTGAERVAADIPHAPWTADLNLEDYADRVDRILDHIRAGDIFQANFTTRFTAPRPPCFHPFDAYRALRRSSAGPFGAYLRCGPALTLASASPERFLSLTRDGRIEARPIKGTTARGADPRSDHAAAERLVASAKDRAENLMIVDLIRNDLGRVAETGSVAVPSLVALESFASVHHLVSVVTAQQRRGLGPIDLLRASFPGGSVTGAPKIRAMEIIDTHEAARRGAYCGTILWLGFDGAMDSSIVIRTLAITTDQVIAQAGGGIVADSDPMAEYAEMRVKLAPLLGVLGGIVAGEG